jgi:hypothetical protein
VISYSHSIDQRPEVDHCRWRLGINLFSHTCRSVVQVENSTGLPRGLTIAKVCWPVRPLNPIPTVTPRGSNRGNIELMT